MLIGFQQLGKRLADILLLDCREQRQGQEGIQSPFFPGGKKIKANKLFNCGENTGLKCTTRYSISISCDKSNVIRAFDIDLHFQK